MRRPTRAFTLIEMLVVVAVISVLIAIMMPALSLAKRQARQAATASAIRELIQGYTLYHTENDGALLLGYPPAYLNGQLLSVTLPTGQTIPGPGSFAGSLSILRYPARMAPYENNVWKIMYQDSFMPSTPPLQGDTVAQASAKAYQLSLFPSFGLNSTFLGGDFSEKGFTGTAPNYHLNMAGPALFRATQVQRPAQTLVFVETAERNIAAGITGGDRGLFRATPPVAAGRQWRAAAGRIQVVNQSADIGMPYSRSTGRIVVAFFDGHAEAMKPADLDDMRLWWPDATAPDQDFVH
ncbi:MAG TPA: type II secretion system protein [Phycisphaerae bacterium]|nr:type II secretion system protein [Phycisphaerae bacterium]